MKISKSYDNLPKFYYRPELSNCLHCGTRLKRSHTAWCKTVVTLQGNKRIYNQAYRCPRETELGHRPVVHRSAYADGISLPYYTYGLDVIALIGQLRLRKHQTIPAIYQHLNEREIPIVISEREVQYLFDTYLVFLACSHGARIEKYRPQIEANGGLILAIDGAKPEKGQPVLYIFRDALTGCRLHAALLYSGDSDNLAREAQVVKALGLPIQAVISDNEAATVKAVADVFPDVPHGLCHIHFLKVAQEPIYLADNDLGRKLKSPLRRVTKLERKLTTKPHITTGLTAKQKIALQRYLDAVRAVTFTKGQAPFQLTGVPIYEALLDITDSLLRAETKRSHTILTALQTMTTPYRRYHETYERVKQQQGWFLGLVELLNVTEIPTYHGATQTGSEVAQALSDYLAELQLLADELPQDAPLFNHFSTRLASWAPGLYWSYEIPRLPRTNNDLEIDIGRLKAQYRHITGRRCLKDYLMRYGPNLTFDDPEDDPEELLAWFQQVDQKQFRDEEAKLEAFREHLRNMRRFRQDPLKFLAETEDMWDDDE